MNPKPWYASRTVWVNALTGIVALSSIANVFPEKWAPFVLAASAIANILLRLVTNQPIQGQ